MQLKFTSFRTQRLGVDVLGLGLDVVFSFTGRVLGEGFFFCLTVNGHSSALYNTASSQLSVFRKHLWLYQSFSDSIYRSYCFLTKTSSNSTNLAPPLLQNFQYLLWTIFPVIRNHDLAFAIIHTKSVFVSLMFYSPRVTSTIKCRPVSSTFQPYFKKIPTTMSSNYPHLVASSGRLIT